MVEKINTDQFEKKVLQNPKTVLVDFYADWCMPCRMVSPLLEEIAAEHEDAEVYKINVDQNGEIAAKYDIMSIPNIISFRGGSVYKRAIGVQPKQKFEELLV